MNPGDVIIPTSTASPFCCITNGLTVVTAYPDGSVDAIAIDGGMTYHLFAGQYQPA